MATPGRPALGWQDAVTSQILMEIRFQTNEIVGRTDKVNTLAKPSLSLRAEEAMGTKLSQFPGVTPEVGWLPG